MRSRATKCPFCHKYVRSWSGVGRHISQTKKCRLKRKKLQHRLAVHGNAVGDVPPPSQSPPASTSDVDNVSSHSRDNLSSAAIPQREVRLDLYHAMEVDEPGQLDGLNAGQDEAQDKATHPNIEIEPEVDAAPTPDQEAIDEPPTPPRPFDSAIATDPHPDPTAGAVLRWVVNVERPSPYAVILKDKEIFEIAHWLANQPLSNEGRDAFLRMSRNQDLPWKNVKKFNECMDSMPNGPEWFPKEIKIKGDRGELTVEVWLRNSLHVVRHLIGDPRFRLYMRYAPVRNWTSALREARIYSEMWSADWWWQMQNMLGEGATVCPVILASDKTQLTTLSGGRQAWPVYLMIGNISKRIRRRPGQGASILVGYIPADNLETCFSDEDRRREARWKLFHKAMEMVVQPFSEVSRAGEEMVCADGGVRRVHPILAAYMGDLAEQWLVTCTQQYRCPVCLVPPKEKGDIHNRYPPRSREQSLQAINDYKCGVRDTIKRLGIREIKQPFWARLPFTNIFSCMPPDILHQMDKGVFGEYLVKWSQHTLGKGEFDRCLKGMPRFSGIRHFKYGIEPIPSNQWTGREAKCLSRVFLSTVTPGSKTDFIRASRAIVDFQQRIRLPEMTDTDLGHLVHDLRVFHSAKDFFIEVGANKSSKEFNGITKLHMALHYAEWIRRMGTLDGYNTEISERLHIDCVKNPWRSTNHVDATEQMTIRLQRKEAWAIACAHMYERGLLPDSLRAHYKSRGEEDSLPQTGVPLFEDYDDYEDEDCEGAVLREQVAGDWVPGEIWHPVPTIYLAKAPTLRKVRGTYLIDEYGARNIIPATQAFLSSLSADNDLLPLDETSLFGVWTRCRLHHDRLPFLRSLDPQIDRVRAYPPKHNQNGTLTRQGYMDCVFYLSNPDCDGLRRYCVGRVRAIFRLPKHLLSFYDKPLVYLETFRPFTSPLNYPYHRMCTTAAEFVQGRRNAIVIPLSRVRAACHLTPQYHCMDRDVEGGPQPLTYQDDLLSLPTQFYLNRHSSDFMFALLDHGVRAGE